MLVTTYLYIPSLLILSNRTLTVPLVDGVFATELELTDDTELEDTDELIDALELVKDVETDVEAELEELVKSTTLVAEELSELAVEEL